MTKFMKAQRDAKQKELEQILISPECAPFWKEKGHNLKAVFVQPDKLKTVKLSAGMQIVADHVYKNTPYDVDFASIYSKDVMEMFTKGDKITSFFNNWDIRDVDVIGFSISNPSVMSNVFEFFEKANISILKSERNINNSPLIIAGGLGVLNPVPYEDFFDAFVIGEGSIAASEMLLYNMLERQSSISEVDILTSMSKVNGVYIPEYTKSVDFQTIDDVAGTRRASLLMSKDKALIFADYSCKSKCGFCEITHVRGDYSFQGVEPIKEYLKEFDSIGVETATLAGCSVTNIPTSDLIEVFDWSHSNLKITNPVIRSVRIDHLPKIASYLDQTEVHIAPETGSDFLRNKVMMKGFSNKIILENLESVIDKASLVRLYHIVGVPGEEQADRDAYIDLVGSVSSMLDKHHDSNKIEIYMYPLLSQPHTPLEEYPIIGLDVFKEYSEHFINGATNIVKDSTSLYIHPLEPIWHLMQGICNLGDFKAGEVLYRGYSLGNDLESYCKACDEFGVDWRNEFSAPYMNIPWDFVKIDNQNQVFELKKKIWNNLYNRKR
jgi:radical SAM superfamily enzyme YgiQ (UPF0313 family)